MFERKFFTYQETVDRLGAPESVRQAILGGALRAYVELNKATTVHWFGNGVGIGDGKTDSCAWQQSMRKRDVDEDALESGHRVVRKPGENDDDRYEETGYYTLDGYFLLSQSDARDIARGHGKISRTIFHLTPARDDGHESYDAPQRFEADVSLQLEALYFRSSDVDLMTATTSATNKADDDSVGTRRLNSYLRIIRALAVMAKLPERGAAMSVQSELETLGFTSPKDTTIRDILAEARGLAPDK